MNPTDPKSARRLTIALILSLLLNVGGAVLLCLAIKPICLRPSSNSLNISFLKRKKEKKAKIKPRQTQKATQQKAAKEVESGDTSVGQEITETFKPVPKSQLRSQPKALKAFKTGLDYPPLSRKLGLEGNVVLRVEITKEGNVKSAVVLEGMGLDADEYAVNTMKKFQFRPAIDHSGRPVDSVIHHTIKYRLN